MKNKSLYYVLFLALVLIIISLGFFDRSQITAVFTPGKNWMYLFVFIMLGLTYGAIAQAGSAIKYYVAKKEGLEIKEEEDALESWFGKLWQKLQDSKPIEEEGEIELDHDYDGIKELDNNLPPWWLYGFYLSIIFAVVYLARYHVFQSAPLQIEEYEMAMAEGEKQKAEYLLTAADLVDESSVVLLTDASKIQEGATIFAANCVACHAADGGGTVGPNLTDEYWLHGGSVKDIFTTIKYGVPDKGMISWESLLGPAKMQAVASYILSLQGTTPAAPKEPQGEKYTPAVDAPADSSVTLVTDSLDQ